MERQSGTLPTVANARMVMARVIPVASARGFRGSTPRTLRAHPTKSPRRKPVGCRDPSPTTPLSECPELKRPHDDATRHPHRFREGLPGHCAHAPKAPGGSRLGCRDPSPTTPLSECPELKRPHGDATRHPHRFREGLSGVHAPHQKPPAGAGGMPRSITHEADSPPRRKCPRAALALSCAAHACMLVA